MSLMLGSEPEALHHPSGRTHRTEQSTERQGCGGQAGRCLGPCRQPLSTSALLGSSAVSRDHRGDSRAIGRIVTCLELWKVQAEKQPCPLLLPFSAVHLPQATLSLSLSLVRIFLSLFLQANTNLSSSPACRAVFSLFFPHISFCSSAYFSCSLAFSGSASFCPSLNFLLSLSPFPTFLLSACLSDSLPPLPLVPGFQAAVHLPAMTGRCPQLRMEGWGGSWRACASPLELPSQAEPEEQAAWSASRWCGRNEAESDGERACPMGTEARHGRPSQPPEIQDC